MAGPENWVAIGAAEELSSTSLRRISAINRDLAVSCLGGKFGVVSNTCNHVGGPLGAGRKAHALST